MPRFLDPGPTLAPRRRARLAPLAGALCLAWSAGQVGQVGAQPRPDTVMSGFEPSGDYVLEDRGSPVPGAKLFLSRRAAAMLVVAPAVGDPILVWARSARVDRIPASSLLERAGGGYDVAEGAARSYLGDVATEGTALDLPVPDHDLRLAPRPALVGLHPLERVLEHSPDYAVALERYAPRAELLAKLRGYPREVRVRIFFGTWCGACKAVLPNALRVIRELAGSKIAFELYGLDHPPGGWQDPEARRLQVQGLPTAIVYRDGREIGRFTGASGFAAPEDALLRALGL
jgi:thiol-disulfide isomerase/thioredoxin